MRDAVSLGSKAGLATGEQSRGIFESDDAREGAQAFMEKRAAVFNGR
jgi:enoyl-CoA hydratase/carnithine racemase